MRTVLLLLVAVPLAAQEKKPAAKDVPGILYPVPLVATPGKKAKVTLRGLKLDVVTEVKSADAKVTPKLLGKPRKLTLPNNGPPASKLGDTELDVELDLPANFAGPLELTAVAPDGSSAPFALTVDGGPRTAEKEPNDGFANPQDVALPATVDATIGKEKDPDVYRFTGKAGDVLTAEVVAARLGSPVDAFLTVYDADRRVLASCDDVEGNADPRLTVTLPRDGVYFAAVIDAHDQGGSQYGYRLRLTAGKRVP